MQSLIRRSPSIWLCAVVLFASSLPAWSQGAGYDAFQTGSGASVDLSSIGLGVVPLQGVPIQSATGAADTIMVRPQAVPSGGGSIPVNMFALFMVSQNPVTFNGQSADVYVTVNNSGGVIPTSVLPQPDSLSPSTGTITVHPDSTGDGGTFDSSITVNADIIIMPHGVSPTNASAMLGHQAASAITLAQTGSSYTVAAPGSSASTPLNNGASAAGSVVSGAPAPRIACEDPCGGGGPPPAATPTPFQSGGFFPRPVHTGPHPVIIVIVPTPTPTPTPTPSPTPKTSPTPTGGGGTGGGCATATPSSGTTTTGGKVTGSATKILCDTTNK